MDHHITLPNLIFVVAVSVGLTLALQLGLVKRSNRAANRLLALALATVVLQMAWVLTGETRLPAGQPYLNWLPLQFSLTTGPLLYFYVLKLTRPGYKFRRKDLLHFVPLAPGIIVFSLLILKVINSAQLILMLQLISAISVIVYLGLLRGLIRDFHWRLADVEHSPYQMRWLRGMLMGFGNVWITGVLFAIADHFYFHFVAGPFLFYLLLAVMMIWIAAASLSRPDVGTPALTGPVPTQSAVAEMKQKGKWLRKAIETGQYYQDPDLSLTSLAGELKVHPHELSRIVNMALGKSFSDLINEYRIRAITRKMRDPAYDRMTLLGIAFDSGFNSKTNFNRAFRQMTGKSPTEYKKILNKERPYYDTEPFSAFAGVISGHKTIPVWSYDKSNRNFMFRNYLKIAWRNLRNNKVYSSLNIVGLATGMAVALLIGLWAIDQYSYDRFLPNYGQAYAVKINYTSPHDGIQTSDQLSLPLAGVLRTTIPGIKYVSEADFVDFPSHDLLVGDKKLIINGGTVANDFLKIFQYPLVRGNVNSVFTDAFSIVLDESTAKALFGNDDPVNKIIKIDNQHDVKVTGVMRDFPANASMQFHFLLPFSFAVQTQSWIKNSLAQWDNNSYLIFVGLQPGVNNEQVAAKIRNLVYQNNPVLRPFKPEVFLYPLKDWHLYSDFKNGKAAGGFIDYVRMFSIIGALVLLIACINFVNLSTARSEKRAREVGVRKAIGSHRADLIFQFLTESVLMTFASFLLSIVFVQLALPAFNALTGGMVQVPYANPLFWLAMTGYVLLTGLLAGGRPAFYLSSFDPIKVLKGRIQAGKAPVLPRKILVVVQFSCSVAFIISTVVVYQQIQYVKNRPTGFSNERLVSTFMTKDLANRYDALKTDLLASGMVENVTKASSTVNGIGWHTGIPHWPGQNAGELTISVGAVIVADNYLKTVGMKLLDGHDFSSNPKADSTNIIINEAAVKRMGLKNPVGQLISFNGINGRSRIIGVVKDALMESPFKPVEPAVFIHTGDASSQVIYRLARGVDPHQAIEKIGKIFDRYNPAYPFTYVFANDEYEHKFNLEALVGKLAGIFAGLAIFISCLGLFGLAAYVAEQRTKEIAVRKVLGASITKVWLLLSADLILLVVIGCFIASPLALYFLSSWLNKYDYRISIGPGVFILSGIAAIIITLFTVSFQAIKAALANPVKSLRSE